MHDHQSASSCVAEYPNCLQLNFDFIFHQQWGTEWFGKSIFDATNAYE